MNHAQVEPGEVYVWEEGDHVTRLWTEHPPAKHNGRPCQVKSKAPNRSCGVKFANDPTVYRVWSTELVPVPGRTYRPWPPVEPNVIQHYK